MNQIGMPAALKERPAPVIELADLAGQPPRLADLASRIVVVNFWASWCPPCREEAPVLERTWRAYRERSVSFVGVAVWDREDDARAFARRFALSYPNAVDVSGDVTVSYGVTGVTETFFADRAGRLVRKWVGPLGERDLTDVLEGLV